MSTTKASAPADASETTESVQSFCSDCGPPFAGEFRSPIDHRPVCQFHRDQDRRSHCSEEP